MKFNYRFILAALLALVIFLPVQQVNAQASNELVVQWTNPDGTVKTDALRDAIAADSARPANRVYKLLKGGFYWLSETITNNGWALRIVGEAPDPTDPYGNPALLQMVARADGSVNGRMITGGGDVTLKNLYLVGADNNGVQTYYTPIALDAANARFIMDNCINERTNFALIHFTAENNDIFITNCTFRNLIGQPSTQQWEGRGIMIDLGADTVIVENNTFFNIGMTAFQMENGIATYLRINHNTFVNIGRNFSGNWFKNAYFANNLFVNCFWHGEGFADYDLVRNPGRDPRGTKTGMWGIGALPAKYGPEEGRRILFAKAASWRDPAFAAYYGDTIRAQPYVGQITQLDFLAKYKQMVIKDTLWLSVKPDFVTYPSDIISSMIQNIKDLRAGITPATPYFWQLPSDPYQPSWPLPENFTYTNTQLMTYGTNNMPLGDLNWFPAKKAEWEAIKAKDIADIQALAGEVVELNTVDVKEAEAGTLSGGATVKEVSGLAYYFMKSGFIEWSFDLPTAKQYDLNMWVNLNSRATSGINFFVNDVEIHDSFRGWDQFVLANDNPDWANLPATGMGWMIVQEAKLKEAAVLPLHLVAGSNKIQLKASWCENMFAGFDVLEAGTTTIVKSLRAADVTRVDIASLVVEGAVWTPSGLRSVKLGTNGTVTLSMTAPSNGTYRVQAIYQNGGTAQTGQIKVDGTIVAASLAFAPKLDSTGTAVLSPSFNLTQGVHSFELTGSGVNLDVVNLIQEFTITGVIDNKIPEGFALEQNYPNPFNPMTKIRYNILKESKVSLKIYDILGRQVATLVDLRQDAGHYEINFDASKYASGVYIYRIIAGDFVQAKKMILIK